jgi:hypothetical protein
MPWKEVITVNERFEFVPVEMYEASKKTYSAIEKQCPDLLLEHSLVSETGHTHWNGKQVYVGSALSNELVPFRNEDSQ